MSSGEEVEEVNVEGENEEECRRRASRTCSCRRAIAIVGVIVVNEKEGAKVEEEDVEVSSVEFN